MQQFHPFRHFRHLCSIYLFIFVQYTQLHFHIRILFEIFQNEFHHLRIDFTDKFTFRIYFISARSAVTVIVKAQRKRICLRYRLSLVSQIFNPVSDRCSRVNLLCCPHIVVIVIVLHLRHKEAFRNLHRSIRGDGKILRAPLHHLL